MMDFFEVAKGGVYEHVVKPCVGGAEKGEGGSKGFWL